MEYNLQSDFSSVIRNKNDIIKQVGGLGFRYLVGARTRARKSPTGESRGRFPMASVTRKGGDGGMRARAPSVRPSDAAVVGISPSVTQSV